MSLPAVRLLTPDTPMDGVAARGQDAQADVLRFEGGLLGFPDCHRWRLADAGRDGLLWLQSDEHDTLAFLLCDPFAFFTGYAVDLPSAVVRGLDAHSLGDLAVFAIITFPGPQESRPTANLQGPVVINPRTRAGMQVVLPDTPWGVRSPLVLR